MPLKRPKPERGRKLGGRQMPVVKGKHYTYTRRFDNKTFRSDGKTFSKAKAKNVAEYRRSNNPRVSYRVVRLGKTNKYAIYSSAGY